MHPARQPNDGFVDKHFAPPCSQGKVHPGAEEVPLHNFLSELPLVEEVDSHGVDKEGALDSRNVNKVKVAVGSQSFPECRVSSRAGEFNNHHHLLAQDNKGSHRKVS